MIKSKGFKSTKGLLNLGNPIVVVCGMPRTGTSMTMQMLHAGGYETHSDIGGPSFELKDTLELPGKSKWIASCTGKAIKILEPTRYTPPRGYQYRFILTKRNPEDHLRSILLFSQLFNMKAGNAITKGNPTRSLEKAQRKINRLLMSYPGSELIEVNFEDTLSNSLGQSKRIASFLNADLNHEKMAQQVKVRPPAAHGTLELQLIGLG